MRYGTGITLLSVAWHTFCKQQLGVAVLFTGVLTSGTGLLAELTRNFSVDRCYVTPSLLSCSCYMKPLYSVGTPAVYWGDPTIVRSFMVFFSSSRSRMPLPLSHFAEYSNVWRSAGRWLCQQGSKNFLRPSGR